MTTSGWKGRFFFFTKLINSHNESIRIANWNVLLITAAGVFCLCSFLQTSFAVMSSRLSLSTGDLGFGIKSGLGLVLGLELG